MASSSCCLLNELGVHRVPVLSSISTDISRAFSSSRTPAKKHHQSHIQGRKILAIQALSSASSRAQKIQSWVAFAHSIATTRAQKIQPLVAFAQSIAAPDADTEAVTETDVGLDLQTLPASPDAEVVVESEDPAMETMPKKRIKPFSQIMERISKDAMAVATKDKDIPDIRVGDILQLRVEVLENKKRISLLKGIVISRRNNGINTTFKIRRVLAGVGVEMVFPLYSPNIKEIKVLSHTKVRRAKLYYLRDKLAKLSSF